MANIRTTTQLTLHGEPAPVEAYTEARSDGSVALFVVTRWRDAEITVSGHPNDVESFFKDGLDLAQEAMESLTPCQRRGKHRSDPTGTEDGCPDCRMEPAVPAFASNGAPW